MIPHVWFVRVITKSLLVPGVTLLLAVSCLISAKAEPKGTQQSPKRDLAKVTREDLTNKIPNFFYFDYPYEPLPGKRLWLRIDDKHWIERYPDGMESKFQILGRTRARGMRGTVVGKVQGDPEKTLTENERKFQVFIPDKDNKDMAILVRHLGQEQSEWRDMSGSENKKTLIKKVE